jgi:glycosyltransferase involved in cell wall biosynthesis
MTNPLISVITVVYNNEKVIERTILSVINQSYANIEYIIIDGASTDKTVDIIKKYSEYLTYWISEPDKGIYDAMNKGINHIHGKWVIFMNSGDIFHSNKVVENVFHQNIPDDKLVIYGNTIVDYVSFQKVKIATNPPKLWKGMIFYHQSSFTRTDILKKYCFDISYHIAADYNFFISVWNDFGEEVFYKTNIFISCYDFSGLSNTNRIMSLQERRKTLKTKHLLSTTKQFYYLYSILRVIVVLFVKNLINKA